MKLLLERKANYQRNGGALKETIKTVSCAYSSLSNKFTYLIINGERFYVKGELKLFSTLRKSNSKAQYTILNITGEI